MVQKGIFCLFFLSARSQYSDGENMPQKNSALSSKENHVNVTTEWQQNADAKIEMKRQATKLESQCSTDFPTPSQ